MGNDEHSNFLGGYPPCVGVDCKTCKNKCKSIDGLKWTRGGKGCYKQCKEEIGQSQRIENTGAGNMVIPDLAMSAREGQTEDEGMSTGAIIGIAVVGLALLGTVGYLAFKK